MAFPLLSDPHSEVIREFGILNTLIDPDDHPWYGIPFPGTYVMDTQGVIVAKFFESSLQLRPSADQLLRSALGQEIVLPPMPAATEAVAFDVSFAGGSVRHGVMQELIVRFAVPEGQHLYGLPVPDGLVATSVELEPDVGLVVKPPVFPPTTPHTLAGKGETLEVFEGDVLVRVPFTQLSRSLTELDDGSLVQRIAGTVRWQSCDDEMCHLPRTERFSIDVPASPQLRAEDEFAVEDGMDVVTHMSEMVARSTDMSLPDALAKMKGTDL